MKEEANSNKQETLNLQVKNSFEINIVLKFGKFGSTVRIKSMAGVLIVAPAVFLI